MGRVIPLKDDLPTSRPAVLTVGLIGANVAVFLWQVLGVGLEVSVRLGGLVPAQLLGLDVGPPALLPPLATVFTSMFLHGSFAHIGGNMLFLWIFGNNVEDALGHVRFVIFYLVAGIAGALAQTGAEAVSRLLAAGGRHFRLEFLNEGPELVAATIAKYRRLLDGRIGGAQVWRELRLLNQLGVTRGS